MKQILFFMSLLVAGSCFTSCHKQDSYATTPTGTTVNNVAFRLTTNTQSDVNSLQWDSAYIVASTVSLDAISSSDGMARHYETSGIGMINAFQSSAPGNMHIPIGTYDTMTCNIVAKQGASAHAIFLYGSYHVNDMMVNIELVIDEPVVLSSKWANKTIIADQQNYAADISIHLDELTKKITDNMLNAATINENNTIVISPTSNTAIYNTMMAGMQNMCAVKFGKN